MHQPVSATAILRHSTVPARGRGPPLAAATVAKRASGWVSLVAVVRLSSPLQQGLSRPPGARRPPFPHGSVGCPACLLPRLPGLVAMLILILLPAGGVMGSLATCCRHVTPSLGPLLPQWRWGCHHRRRHLVPCFTIGFGEALGAKKCSHP